MKVLIIYAHPYPHSFNKAILESFTTGLAESRHSYEVVDLYEISFDPCMGRDELAIYWEKDVPEDVRIQQEKVSEADGLVFIHPVWWIGPPAILKGWLDRVLTPGFAFGFDKQSGQLYGLLNDKRILVINTDAAPDDEKEAYRIRYQWAIDALDKIYTDWIFGYCRITNVQTRTFHVVSTDDKRRQEYLEEARTLGQHF